MKQVRALRLGYYNNARIREGQVFYIKNDKEFSKLWMEEIGEDESPRSRNQIKPQGRRPSYIVDNSDEVI